MSDAVTTVREYDALDGRLVSVWRIPLLHGFPTSSRMFRNLIPALADKYHLIAPDYLDSVTARPSPYSPALLTAGMTLVDTTDGVLMVGAYGWAFVKPVRKLYYNLTITFVSIIVALIVGGIEAMGLLKRGNGNGVASIQSTEKECIC